MSAPAWPPPGTTAIPAGDPAQAALSAPPPDDDCIDVLASAFGYGKSRVTVTDADAGAA